ncbi:hypothetical protein Q6670_004041 [Salmonella enterica]|nr:hypothetical protein [Salmonella enterica]
MKVQIEISKKAGRMRLSRHLTKIRCFLITARVDSPAQAGIEKYTIIDGNNEIVSTSAELTPLLREYSLIKDWEYIEGEERENDK